MNKRLVYTVILGDYDQLNEVGYKSEGVDYICVTDNKELTSETWSIRCVEGDIDSSSLNRKYKFFPTRFFNYEESIYIDGNIEIVGDVLPLFSQGLSSADLSIPKHPFRDCIYKEAIACYDSRKVDGSVFSLIDRYRSEGFPEHFGLYENNCIVRKHSSNEVNALMEEWWTEFESGIKRDQLSLVYLLWKMELVCSEMPFGPRYSNRVLKLKFHNSESLLPLIRRVFLYISLNSRRAKLYFYLDKLIKCCKRSLRRCR